METSAALPSDLWERTPPEAQASIRALEARLSAVEARVQTLQEQNRALQERLHQHSRHSSRPPSSDPPQSPRPRRPRGQRRVHATVALCTGAYRWSKRTTQQVRAEGFGVPMSGGTLSPWEQATTAAGAAPVEEARPYVHEQAVAPLDATSWCQGGKRAWLWVAVTSLVTVFLVRMARGGQVARERVGEHFSGLLVPDRYRAYNWYPVRWRQLCWAHLLRDVEAMRGRGGHSEPLGAAWLAQVHQRLAWWHRGREGPLQRSTFRSSMSPLRQEVERRWEAGNRCGVPKTAGTCRDILKRRQALWTCVQVEGVEPTNNTAERALRPCVLWRKGSFGT